MKSKFLILNPSQQIDPIIQKANLQHQKNGPFELILLLQSVPTPLATFNQQAYYYEESPRQVSSNLSTVNGLLKLSSGLNVLFFGPNVTCKDLKVDILILEKWPVKIAAKVDIKYGDMTLDKVIEQTKPRYIITRGAYYEHPPFQWDNGAVTRFISLNEEGLGEKWFYAFNLAWVPEDVEGLGPNPFTTPVTDPQLDTDTISTGSGVKRKGTEGEPRKKPKVVTPNECFFCLSNPKAETHMIVTIATLTYMTIAKGPLTRSNKDMPFSGHGIIIPIEHTPKLTKEINDEINDTETKLYHKFKEVYPDMTLVTFEFNLKTNVHYHRQYMPIHKKFLEENDFEQVLKEKCQINNEKYEKNHRLEFEEINPDEVNVEEEYVMFKVYKESVPKVYINKITEEKMVNLQFPRRVLSYIIRSPKRLYWDKCQQPRMKEVKDCEEFKKFFDQH